jgi:hypothetical protein
MIHQKPRFSTSVDIPLFPKPVFSSAASSVHSKSCGHRIFRNCLFLELRFQSAIASIPTTKVANSVRAFRRRELSAVDCEHIYPWDLQYAQFFPPPLPPVPPEMTTSPQLPTGAAVFPLPPRSTLEPASGNSTSVPSTVLQPLLRLAKNISGPSARFSTASGRTLKLSRGIRARRRPPEMVTTAQFMYISRFPWLLNHDLNN